jgi:hypothetical protein
MVYPLADDDGLELAPEALPQLEVLIKGVFEKERLLDIIANFIVFENDGEKLSKKRPLTTSILPPIKRWKAPLRPPRTMETVALAWFGTLKARAKV